MRSWIWKFEDFRDNLRLVFHDDLKYLVEAYFKASSRMVELGGFDFVAHLDKISMNGSLVDSTLTEQGWYNRLLWDYMSLIAKKGVMVEVNTKDVPQCEVFQVVERVEYSRDGEF